MNKPIASAAAFEKKTMKLVFILIFFSYYNIAFADNSVTLTDKNIPFDLGLHYYLLKDPKAQYNSFNILQQQLLQSKEPVPVFTLPVKNIWLNFKLKNQSSHEHLFLSFGDANIANIWLYEKTISGLVLIKHTGAAIAFYARGNENTTFDIDLYLPVNAEKEYYVLINSPHAIELPVTINSPVSLNKSNFAQALIIGLYCGIVISILLYNLFLFFATRDKSYLIYVIYLFTVGLAQISFAGWSFRFLWPSFPSFNSFMVIGLSCLSGCFAISFAKSFLNTKSFTPQLDKVLSFLFLVYFIGVVLSFTHVAWISYVIFNLFGILLSVTLIYTSVVIYKKGFRPAYFYFISWSILLACLVIYLFKNLSIAPRNNFTHFILYYAISAEAILFSIALADRINVLKKENELAQAEALQRAEENELLVREQNVILESKVENRTREIKEANIQLNFTLDTLKDAQAQLVDAEKMASLGQLTAGIAHEINNPINFVKSNINPLRLDVKDLLDVLDEYGNLHTISDESSFRKKLQDIQKFKNEIDVDFIKTEIKSLIVGIEDGAERTAEIVRGLKTFSRIDEAELKTADIHDGISSTLVLLKNSMPYFIKVEKNFKAEGIIECFPGKLNQVFMNILNNGIQAIKEKTTYTNNELITVCTRDVDNFIEISIKDTGIGMTEEVKHKIFEPFFTTKEVGEGTGLGMAIVFKIIQKHNGKIDIKSKPFEGSEFIITLPHKRPISDHF